MLMGTQPRLINPPKVLLVQQTGLAVHPLLPVPMTVIGLQVRPTRPVRSLTTMPRSPKRPEIELEVGDWVDWQHWTGPVLQLPVSVRAETSAGEATATAARAATETTASLLNIVKKRCWFGEEFESE
jgi:hypothetical protein